MNYVGKLLNGYSFDSNTAGTFQVKIGEKRVVTGFESGLATLRKGEKATLIFPSSLGYTSTGRYDNSTRTYVIPPYSPLIFEVEILKVE